MKKIIIALGILIVGILIGWLISNTNGNVESVGDKSSANQEIGTSDNPTMWTCSMHPQIMQPEPGDCPICGMDLIPAESGGEGLAVDQIRMTENAMALANIQTIEVGQADGEGENTISLSGKIVANEEGTAVQASYFDGRIEKLNVNFEGQKVNQGQLLATIYAPKLIAAQQELITAANLKESQPALYGAVRNKLKLWKLSENQIDAIEESGQVRENFPIYATVAGTVSEILAREGDYVSQGEPILKVNNFGTVWAEFDAYESDVSHLKVGQQININSKAYPTNPIQTKISFIDPVLNTQTRTVTVRAVLQNREDKFKPGMFVTGKVNKSEEQGVETIQIPASAVMWTGERSLVYVKPRPNEPVFEMREVILGSRKGEMFTILDGLEIGDEVVVNGTFTVDAAAQLQGKKSMMNAGTNTSEPMVQGTMVMNLSSATQKKILQAIEPYLQMKDAFVKGQTDEISRIAGITKNRLREVEKENLEEMVKTHLSKSIEMLEAIENNQNIENQRAHLVILNQNLVPIIQNIDNIEQTYYLQRCPMADNNKGAVWLSTEEEIRNPYFGDAMLTCGEVIEVIK